MIDLLDYQTLFEINYFLAVIQASVLTIRARLFLVLLTTWENGLKSYFPTPNCCLCLGHFCVCSWHIIIHVNHVGKSNMSMHSPEADSLLHPLWDLMPVIRIVSSFHLSSSSLYVHCFPDSNILTETRVVKHHQSANPWISVFVQSQHPTSNISSGVGERWGERRGPNTWHR